MKRDYYEVLGISRDAGDKEIKKAFRALAREIHPDVNVDDPEAESKFKEAAEAYEVLSNPSTRATYDRFGHQGLGRGSFHDFSQFSFEDIIRTFFGEGLFAEDLFGGGFGAGRRGPARGADIGAAVEISLKEAATGIKREIEFDAVDYCDVCTGTGAAPGTEREACPACQGSGQVRTVTRTAFGQFVRSGPCRECGGEGSTVSDPCGGCKGSGRTVAHKHVEIDIPPGISSGQSLRIPGKGGAGDLGGPAGDLFVQVTVSADEQLARDGDDLIHHLPLKMTDAALGARIGVPTLEGEEEIDIKPGIQPGEVVTLKGRGMPLLRGRGRGDLKIVVDVMVPRHLSEEQKEILGRFAETASDKHYSRESSIFDKIRAAFR